MRNGLQDCMVWLEWLTLTKSHGYCWTTYACNSPDFQSCATPGLFFMEEGVSRNNSICRGEGVEGLRCIFFSFFVSLLCEFNRFVNLYFLRVCVWGGGGRPPPHSYPIPFRSIEVNDFIVAILKA